MTRCSGLWFYDKGALEPKLVTTYDHLHLNPHYNGHVFSIVLHQSIAVPCFVLEIPT